MLIKTNGIKRQHCPFNHSNAKWKRTTAIDMISIIQFYDSILAGRSIKEKGVITEGISTFASVVWLLRYGWLERFLVGSRLNNNGIARNRADANSSNQQLPKKMISRSFTSHPHFLPAQTFVSIYFFRTGCIYIRPASRGFLHRYLHVDDGGRHLIYLVLPP
jgi:hypothetical protein